MLCAAPEIDGPFAVINSDDYYGIEAYRLLYDFLAVPRPERSYAMVGFRLRNTVTANGSVSRGVCTERNGMLESITERTRTPPTPRTVSTSSTCRAIRRCP